MQNKTHKANYTYINDTALTNICLANFYSPEKITAILNQEKLNGIQAELLGEIKKHSCLNADLPVFLDYIIRINRKMASWPAFLARWLVLLTLMLFFTALEFLLRKIVKIFMPANPTHGLAKFSYIFFLIVCWPQALIAQLQINSQRNFIQISITIRLLHIFLFMALMGGLLLTFAYFSVASSTLTLLFGKAILFLNANLHLSTLICYAILGMAMGILCALALQSVNALQYATIDIHKTTKEGELVKYTTFYNQPKLKLPAIKPAEIIESADEITMCIIYDLCADLSLPHSIAKVEKPLPLPNKINSFRTIYNDVTTHIKNYTCNKDQATLIIRAIVYNALLIRGKYNFTYETTTGQLLLRHLNYDPSYPGIKKLIFELLNLSRDTSRDLTYQDLRIIANQINEEQYNHIPDLKNSVKNTPYLTLLNEDEEDDMRERKNNQ